MHVNDLRRENELIDLFCNLAEVPSPSLDEFKLIKWIEDYLTTNSIDFEVDNYSNIIIKIPATDTARKPILLSAHMDVVGDDSPINLGFDGEFIHTDQKRTLGADDKVGVACALLLATELNTDSTLAHGGLEVVLTRDEEKGMTGIRHLNYSELDSKYILVLDTDKLGQILISGASYIFANLKVETKYGGHSGISIHEENRLNASKLIAELITEIPQGVYHSDKTGTITSINIGTVISGEIQNTCKAISEGKTDEAKFIDFMIKNSVTNVINTEAHATYSIRSADLAKQNELIDILKLIVSKFNLKYEGLAHAKLEIKEHFPAFESAGIRRIVNGPSGSFRTARGAGV